MMDPEDRRALERARQRERQLEQEIEAVRLVIKGYESMAAMEGASPVAGDASAADSEDEQPGQELTAKEAVLRVVKTRPGPFRARHIASAAEEHGWVIDSQHPEQAIRTALLRLVESGYLERVGHGLYDVSEPDIGSAEHNGSGDQRTDEADVDPPPRVSPSPFRAAR